MCPEFEERLLQYGELAVDERDVVDQHAAHCEDCRSFLSALDQVDTALAASSAQCVSPDFSRAVDLRRQGAMRPPSMIPEMLDAFGWASIIAVMLGLAAFFVPSLDFSYTLAIVIGTILLCGGFWISGRCYGDLGHRHKIPGPTSTSAGHARAASWRAE